MEIYDNQCFNQKQCTQLRNIIIFGKQWMFSKDLKGCESIAKATMWHLFPTELIHPAWCLPLILFVLLFTAWCRRKANIIQEGQIVSINMTRYIFNNMLNFIKSGKDSTSNMAPADHLIPLLSGVSQLHDKHKIVKIDFVGLTYILCFKASTCESILKSSVALNKDSLYKLMRFWIGKSSIFVTESEKWKLINKILSRAFHLRAMKDFLPMFNDQSMMMIEKLKKCCGQEIKIDDDLKLCSVNIIGEAIMGVDMKAQEKEATEYYKAASNVTEVFTGMLMNPFYRLMPYIFWPSLPIGRIVKNNMKAIHSFSRKIILDRKATVLAEMKNSEVIKNCKENGVNVQFEESKILLDILLHRHFTEKSLNMEDLQREVDVFFQGGHGTVAASLEWTLYLLGLNKDIQETLYQEIRSVFGDDKERLVTADDLKEIKYMDCVLKESLRLFPPVPHVARRTTEDIKSGPYTIPANSSVVISMFDVHRDPAIFPNPEVFDPNRFLPENCSGRHPFAFLAFLAGPRNCVGKKFAMMEMSVLLINFLRNFSVHSLDQRDKLILVASLVLYAKNGLRMILEKR